MSCPKCLARLKWDEGAYCTRCMFEASTYAPAPEPVAVTASEAEEIRRNAYLEGSDDATREHLHATARERKLTDAVDALRASLGKTEPVAVTEVRELLERCLDEIDCDIYDDPGTQQLVFDGRAWLAAHPKPGPSGEGT